MMKWRRAGRAGLMVCMAAVLWLGTGCGKQFETEPKTSEGSSEDKESLMHKDENLTVVGVSQVGSESVWRTAHTASIQNTFTKENGYFLIFDNARQKQENQIKAIRSFISQQVDYIVFSPLTEDGWDTVLQEAKDAGIPVILMDRKVKVEDESLYTTWVGSNFVKEGKDAGRWLANYLKKQNRGEEQIDIVVLQGTTGSTSMIGRTQGFDQEAAEHENWNVLEQVDAEFTTAKGKEEMKKMFRKYNDIDVVVSQNDDMTFGVLEAIEEEEKTCGEDGDIIVISFDGVKSALEKVKEGLINVDVECNPLQSEFIEKVIKKIEKGETVAKEYYVPEKIFTRKNVEDFINDRAY